MRRFRRRKHDDEQDDIIEGEIEELDDSAAADEAINDRSSSAKARRGQYFEAEQPLERVAPDIPTPDEAVISEYVRQETPQPEPKQKSARRLRLPNIRIPNLIVWSEVRPGLLLLASVLTGGGVFWTLHNLNATSDTAEAWWPAVILGIAFLSALYSLLRREAGLFLGGVALIGASFSLLLDTQGYIDWEQSLAGIVFIAIGIGIVARGLLLRQGSTA